ncbi:hypothetical protein HF086_005724 [Spodoptera exigua]|uniref:CRAL-TRIO domain-containing protein n=1 Tax=Spodoptera exigua TaxID=7107 RepID=A0A922MYE3_SPOEX|nr:hypothetical protein HF086_005724 [Spodoptera exigua]
MSVRPLTPALEKKAREELNEDPKRLKDDLQHIKDWLAKQPHLKARTDDQWLVAFLRGCKFSLERTKEKVFIILPKAPGPDAPQTSIIRPALYDPNKYDILEVMSATNVLMRILLMEDDNATVAGGQSILDLEGVTMAHFMQMTPVTMKKMVVLGQDASPMRMKGTHYLNTPPGFETVFNVMKGLLNEKNKNRLFVHNKNYDELYKYIPKDVLPAEYGGNAGTVASITDYWRNKVKEYSAWLEEDNQYRSDESKRPGKPKTAEDMFGVEGSFRQLQVD